MRQTLFLVPAKQLAVFVRGTARRAEREIRWARGKGVPDRVLDAAIHAALGVLDEPRTRSEIAERVSRALGVQMQSVHGGGWGHQKKISGVPVGSLTYPVVDLLHLAAARGVICYGPPRANEPTFVRADAWIPRWRDLPGEQAEDLLLRMYLRAYAPATANDFAVWSGISFTEAREIWARQQTHFAIVNVDGWEAAVLRDDLAALTQAKFTSPHVRLLPYFDSFILGHREREHLAIIDHQPRIYRPQGWISPVVLVDGRAVATWQHTRVGNRLNIKVSKFEGLSRSILAGIREETREIGRFLESSDVTMQID
jgi:hypothetical protein